MILNEDITKCLDTYCNTNLYVSTTASVVLTYKLVLQYVFNEQRTSFHTLIQLPCVRQVPVTYLARLTAPAEDFSTLLQSLHLNSVMALGNGPRPSH